MGGAVAATVAGAAGGFAEETKAASNTVRQSGSTYRDILRVPDRVIAFAEARHPIPLARSGAAWQAPGIELRTLADQSEVAISLTTSKPLIRLHLRWNVAVDAGLLILGDAWERSYGDLAWRGIVPERPMPWYFATTPVTEFTPTVSAPAQPLSASGRWIAKASPSGWT